MSSSSHRSVHLSSSIASSNLSTGSHSCSAPPMPAFAPHTRLCVNTASSASVVIPNSEASTLAPMPVRTHPSTLMWLSGSPK